MEDKMKKYTRIRFGIPLLCVVLLLCTGCTGTEIPPSSEELAGVPFYAPGYTTLADTGGLTAEEYVRYYNQTHSDEYGPVELRGVDGEEVTLFFFRHPSFFDTPDTLQMTFILYGKTYPCVLTQIDYTEFGNRRYYMGQLTEDPQTMFTVLLGPDNRISTEIPWKGKIIEVRPVQSMKRNSTTYSAIEDFQGRMEQRERYLHVAFLRESQKRITNTSAFPETSVPTGLLSVTTVPPTAYVYIDGLFAGTAHGSIWGNVPPGNHTIRVVKEGYISVTDTVTIPEAADDHPRIFSPVLKKDSVNGSIALIYILWADEIMVGDQHFFGKDVFQGGNPNLYVTDLTPGEYTVRLDQKEGESIVLENVPVASGYVTYIDNLAGRCSANHARITYERI